MRGLSVLGSVLLMGSGVFIGLPSLMARWIDSEAFPGRLYLYIYIFLYMLNSSTEVTPLHSSDYHVYCVSFTLNSSTYGGYSPLLSHSSDYGLDFAS